MTVKSAQARINLANIIESLLGYPVKKITTNTGQPSTDQSYGSKGDLNPLYHINSDNPILARAQKRQDLLLIKQQQNIETILAKAMEFCPDVASNKQPDADWIERFIALCEDTSNESMQTLWAKILTGETLNPGTFSIKSLQTLKHMTQREADALQKCVSLSSYNAKDDSHFILLGFYKKPSLFDLLRKGNKVSLNLGKTGISFPDILTLMDLNLLYRKEIESAVLKAGQELTLSFLSQKVMLRAKSSDLVLSYYKFTQTGDELSKLINYPVNKVYKQLINNALEGEFDLTWHVNK
ncbi:MULTISPECIES: TIGR03899 family protein [unclassified Pseudoalteromonas]|uniref:TIGR03899 family protein n=1 Tax=unclassified Pseudoalteromonas TaxID=194690 RepID=UPI000B6889E8|nr:MULTISPECIES: TIGR03899 family protein [unclassified Pseudoalteromonas]MAJ41399.1 TIGR03899 family protein [Pseudoalteromonadaceae bacterium]OUX83043.1 MAG: TIGR03899 family protein [Pseudoalteromonas sp. TMED43]MDC9563332.1 TIGR03899 family protein [Pseudoalteromonas sp. GAB2316C]MDC9567653.1 TIGR03899 family protein [Pseudoalteromonas sp. GABNB9D]MDC9571930.1 TIGR03899 family protein [Pseudoalteromonas sp. GABNS16A]|tara:strand:+ start:248 stop:1135 length:888 start_codon:yes stop_codon:yes gene_type:complete